MFKIRPGNRLADANSAEGASPNFTFADIGHCQSPQLILL